jgi:hypothetical protein
MEFADPYATSARLGRTSEPDGMTPAEDPAFVRQDTPPRSYDEEFYVEGEFLDAPVPLAPDYEPPSRRNADSYDEYARDYPPFAPDEGDTQGEYGQREMRMRRPATGDDDAQQYGGAWRGTKNGAGASETTVAAAEWDSSGMVASARNFRQDIRVFASFAPNDFANTLMLATLLLALVALGRGLVSFIATVSNVELNMVHLHIADVGLLVFGVFMLMTVIMFFYVYDYSETTYQHKLTVMKPYMAAVFFYGAGVIALWTFTRDHGEYVDYTDAVEILRYKITHLFFTLGSILVLIFIPDAIFAHKHPEAETEDKFFLVPSEAHR